MHTYIKIFQLLILTMISVIWPQQYHAQTLRIEEKPRLLPKPATDSVPAIKNIRPIAELRVDSSQQFTGPYSMKRDDTKAAKLIVNTQAIQQMEDFINKNIKNRVMPGCQVMAVKDGIIVYEKSFGTFNFNAQNPVTNHSLYDIASVTKIASTTLAIMKLYEEHKIQLHGTLMAYVPETKGTNKANLKLSDLLTHQAGLKSWIPFYKATLDSITGLPMAHLYSKKSTDKFSIPVAHQLYGHESLKDTMWKRILASPLENKGKYVYSDLDLLFLERVVENITGMPLDMYVEEHFYKEMGLKNITYNPWNKDLLGRTVPTENDMIFRRQIVKGYVHDQAAAMLGGVAGHAGLFSNANDVAAIMQMLIDGGTYNGKRYFKKETVDLFTGYRSSISRRGYGFDKPEKQAGKGGPAADICSKATFGHQGFTGTCTWADPSTGIVFVMLSNRVYPSAENSAFGRNNVRTEVQRYIYKALGF